MKKLLFLISLTFLIPFSSIPPAEAQLCPEGTEFEPDSNICFAFPVSCPAGTEFDPTQNICFALALNCPAGTAIGPSTGQLLCTATPTVGCPGELTFNPDLGPVIGLGACILLLPSGTSFTCPDDTTLGASGFCEAFPTSSTCPADTSFLSNFGGCEFDSCSTLGCIPDCPPEGNIVTTGTPPFFLTKICIVPPVDFDCPAGDFDFQSGVCTSSVLECPPGTVAGFSPQGLFCAAIPASTVCPTGFEQTSSGNCRAPATDLTCPDGTTSNNQFGGCVTGSCTQGPLIGCPASLSCPSLPNGRVETITTTPPPGFPFPSTTTSSCVTPPDSITCPTDTAFDFAGGGCVMPPDPLFCPSGSQFAETEFLQLCVAQPIPASCPAGTTPLANVGVPACTSPGTPIPCPDGTTLFEDIFPGDVCIGDPIADEDGDGLSDQIEIGPDPNNPTDTDNDGIPDFQDDDSDNDGIPDNEEIGDDPNQPRDSDFDGIPDYQETDSDDDGVNDGEDSEPTDPCTPNPNAQACQMTPAGDGGGGMAVGGEMIPVDSTSLLVAGAQMNAAWMIPVIVSGIGIGLLLQSKQTKLKHNSCPSCKLESDDIFTLGDKTVGKCVTSKCRVSLFFVE